METLIILGMHRSGTSLLTRLMNIRGLALGQNMVPALPDDNETGFWEQADIVALNERILQHYGTWHLGLGQLPANFAEDKEMRLYLLEAARILENEFLDKRFFGFKDPRTCRTLPFWQKLLQPYPLKTGYVIGLRHPWEVARSLEKRNNLPIEEGLMLWLLYNLEAERRTRNQPRVFVPYASMLNNANSELARIAHTLGFHWPIPEEDAAKELAGFIRPDLKHNHAETPKLPPLVEKTYMGLQHGNLEPNALDSFYKEVQQELNWKSKKAS